MKTHEGTYHDLKSMLVEKLMDALENRDVIAAIKHHREEIIDAFNDALKAIDTPEKHYNKYKL